MRFGPGVHFSASDVREGARGRERETEGERGRWRERERKCVREREKEREETLPGFILFFLWGQSEVFKKTTGF